MTNKLILSVTTWYSINNYSLNSLYKIKKLIRIITTLQMLIKLAFININNISNKKTQEKECTNPLVTMYFLKKFNFKLSILFFLIHKYNN